MCYFIITALHIHVKIAVMAFPVGKIKLEYLSELLNKYRGASDPSVIVGPRVGEDAAVIDTGSEELLIAKTDPITFATEEIGEYVITINANDIACMGGRPRWFLAAVLLPEGVTDRELIERIFSQISEACKRLGIAICGGHTEVTYGLERPVVVGQMLGTVSGKRLIRSSGALRGDHILLTKGIAIEATSILAREKPEELRGHFDRGFIERCRNYLYNPGISVVRDAEVAVSSGGIHAMHDPTEGGLATGLHELAASANVGLEIWHKEIVIFPETAMLCDLFGLNPLGLIASGALLIAADPEAFRGIMEALSRAGIPCYHIGVVKGQSEGITMIVNNEREPLPRFDQDEISWVF